MLCVLQIVFRNHPVAGALCITAKLRIFFCDMLGGAADLYVRAGAVVGTAERVTALAVEVVVTAAATAAVIVATTPSTTLILLSWPHLSFTNSSSLLIGATRLAGQNRSKTSRAAHRSTKAACRFQSQNT
jgi:hypothetical protein